jgi:hypothetical protein
MFRNVALGNSEGLMAAAVLGAVDRHLSGHRRQAFLLGLAAALLRPEAWPFFGLYGLWLVWRERSALRLVAAGFASLPVLWLGPELWGSGNFNRASDRAQQPNPNSPRLRRQPGARGRPRRMGDDHHPRPGRRRARPGRAWSSGVPRPRAKAGRSVRSRSWPWPGWASWPR